MSHVAFPYFDCDNHFYESHDAFTRYIEPEFKSRGDPVGRGERQARLMVRREDQPLHPQPHLRIPSPSRAS